MGAVVVSGSRSVRAAPSGYAPFLSSFAAAQDSPWRHSQRQILDGVFHVVRRGRSWQTLPRDVPPWGTVSHWFRQRRLDGPWQRILVTLVALVALVALRRATRRRAGRDLGAAAALRDSQSFHIGEASGGNKGSDKASNVPSRKRCLPVDTTGRLLAEMVTPADTSDNRRARKLFAGLAPLMPRLELTWAVSADAGAKPRTWCEERAEWRLESVPPH